MICLLGFVNLFRVCLQWIKWGTLFLCHFSKHSGVNKRIFISRTFFRLVSHKVSKHCAFIGNIKIKCLSVLFNLFFFLFGFTQEVEKSILIVKNAFNCSCSLDISTMLTFIFAGSVWKWPVMSDVRPLFTPQ